MRRIILFWILTAAAGHGFAQTLTVARGVRLPQDSATRVELISCLQGWFDQRNGPDSANTYIPRGELPSMTLLMDELRAIDQALRRDSAASCRCYLGNVAPLDSGHCLVQINYIEVRKDSPLLRACCSVMARREGARWMVSSMLEQNTPGWKSKVIGNCRFYFETGINEARAREYVKRIASYDRRLGAGATVIDFYCCRNAVEAARLFGLDYTIENNGAPFNDFSADDGDRTIDVSGDRMKDGFNDWDPHDNWHGRLHRVVPVATINRPVDEGMAYLYGGSWRTFSWDDVLHLFREYSAAHPDADWLALYKNNARFVAGQTPLYVPYAINSLIVRRLENTRGFAAAMPLLTCGPRLKGDGNYFAALKQVCGVGEEGFNDFVTTLLKE